MPKESREQRRVRIAKEKHGPNIFRESGKKGGRALWQKIRLRTLSQISSELN